MANKLYKDKAGFATTKPGKASGKATNYDAVITDPGYGKNPSASNRNNAKKMLLDGAKTGGGSLDSKTGSYIKKPAKPGPANDRTPISKPGTGGKKVKVTPVTNSNIGPKLNARYSASIGGNKLASGKPTYDAVITDPGYGKKTGSTTKPKLASGKAPVVYETPGFRVSKKAKHSK